MKSVLLALVVVYVVQNEAARTLPNFVTPCKLKTSDISKCYKDNIEKLRSRLEKGIPELQLQGIDPLKVNELVLSRNDTPAVAYRVVFKDLLLVGGKDFKIEELNVDIQKPSFKMQLSIPKVTMTSAFLAKGVLLGFNLNNPGSEKVDFGGVIINYSSEGEKVTKKDNTYIEWNDGQFNAQYDEINIEIDGILSDPNQLKLFNEAINENARALAPQIEPVLKSAFGAYITESLRRVHKLFPVKILYPEN